MHLCYHRRMAEVKDVSQVSQPVEAVEEVGGGFVL